MILIPAIFCVMVLMKTSRERQSAFNTLTASEAEIQQLKMENQRLKEEIDALRYDPKVIERIARDELNMLRPDELMLSFANRKEASTGATTSSRMREKSR